MSLEAAQLLKPKASAVIAGKAVSPDSVSITFSVNSFPSATVRFHDKGSNNRKVSSVPEEMASRVAADQTAMFEVAKGGSVTLDDGRDGKLTFQGYTSNTTYSLGVGMVGQSTTIIHKGAILGTLATNIYGHSIRWRMRKDYPQGDSRYTTWMSNVLKSLVDNWQKDKNNTSLGEADKIIIERTHANNAAPLKEWYAVCENSAASNSKLGKLASDPQTQMGMCETIKSVYFNSYGNFVSTMQQFGTQFQMIYVPNLESDDYPGKYISIRRTMDSGETKEVYIVQMELCAGNDEIFPVTSVLMKGGPAVTWRNGITPTPTYKFAPSAVLAVFPDTTYGGRMQTIMAPGWVPLIAGPGLTDVANNSPIIDKYGKAMQKINPQTDQFLQTDVRQILLEFTRNHYIDMALSGAVANIVVPLDLSWKPGKVYSVKTGAVKGKSGKPLFKGFLYGVQHDLDIAERGSRAFTRLMFTHMRAGDFELPGISN